VEVAVEGQRIRRAVIAQPVAQARQIINVAKLKTHGLMGFTGAVKNLFGCIPGTEKATMHLRLADREHFAGMLVDLYLALKPQLSIIDGIVAMEGQGPRQGNPRPVGLLIAGTDGVAVDAVACAVVGIDPMSIPTIRVAHQQGVGQGDLTKIRILGAPLEEVQVRDFKPAETSVTLGGVPKPIWNLLQKQLTSRPYIITERCVGCGVCARCCPADTIVLDKTAKIVDDKCIRCYCCHELCPEDAVGLAPGFLQRVIGFFRK
jgi:Pyruvate/2-oxoacid:ferredoxin oxidoreductase delta subunit